MHACFQDNKYYKWYIAIINNAIQRNWNKKTCGVYIEQHHIIPKSIESNNTKVNLTAREHYICHWLLLYAVKPEFKRKMSCAFKMMNYENPSTDGRRYISARGFDASKRVWNEINKNNHPRKGKTHSPEARKKISEAQKGAAHHPSGERHYMFGKKWDVPPRLGMTTSEETKQKISENLSRVYVVTNPSGESHEIHGLRKFCRDNNLDISAMSNVAKGKRSSHKGWSVKEVSSK